MIRACPSLASSLGVVPDAMSEWKPESAPQAIVMNRNGNRAPANAGPFPFHANSLTAGAFMTGCTTRMPMASSAMVPTFMNVDR
ncbi:Uncharacterised protein [Mycobacteroides abscessus subsp. abscessus]|nr:Uncharacterised protein [Mycobacteroides abscessus subsp. abscessus]